VVLCRDVPTLQELLDDATHLPAELKDSALEEEAAVLCSMAAASQDVAVQRYISNSALAIGQAQHAQFAASHQRAIHNSCNV
jgi:hypothetical protein